MTSTNARLLALALLSLPLTLPAAALAQAAAPAPATPERAAAAGVFIKDLSDRAFGVLRDKSLTRADALAQFKTMLRQNFALDEIGAKLIRRQRASLSPEQLTAYRAAFPDFVTNVYTARLFDYSDSTVTIVRTVPRGTRGDVDVYARITRPGASQPIDSIWAVRPKGSQWLVTNLTVAGINVALTQEADFASYIQRNGFDALVEHMRTANAKDGVHGK